MDVVRKIEALFERRGASIYMGEELARRESVSALEHALQAAQLAEWAHADNSLVAAALLHDLGQLIDGPAEASLNSDQRKFNRPTASMTTLERFTHPVFLCGVSASTSATRSWPLTWSLMVGMWALVLVGRRSE